MRVIIRFSLNRDRRSELRNVLKTVLENHGITWTGRMTGTYEGNVSETAIRDATRIFWNRVANFPGAAHVDHFWMYADKAEDAAEQEE
jgi:hypothetical protein